MWFQIALTGFSALGRTANAQRISPYGLYANWPLNTKLVKWNILGQEENKVCLAFSQADRFKNLAEGEVIVGNPKTGSYIKFAGDSKIEIVGTDEIEINASGDVKINVTGDIDMTVSGNVDVDATQVNLGVGGNQIARLGDQITVNVGGTDYIGAITSAGTNTSI